MYFLIYRKKLIGWVPLVRPFGKRKVLGIGCENGYLLEVLKKLDNRIWVDTSPWIIKICRRNDLTLKRTNIKKLKREIQSHSCKSCFGTFA